MADKLVDILSVEVVAPLIIFSNPCLLLGEGFVSADATVVPANIALLLGEGFIIANAVVPAVPTVCGLLYIQRIYDSGNNFWVYYALPVLSSLPGPTQTSPNNSGSFVAGTYQILEILL